MKVSKSLFILVIALGVCSNCFSQDIVFDKGVRAGELIAFPSLSDPNSYYYLADKVQVAKHPDGKPMFSFTRYVKNKATGAEDGSATSESDDAGGVVHVVVSLAVPQDMVKAAETAIRRVNTNGKLVGPVIYKSGKIALISSVIGENGELTKKVVGLGSAPILEGHKAAVAVLLSKQGADILWATFQSPTPDLSFQFEMEAKGYLSPKRVKIEANFEQIYAHKSFEAAAVSPVFAAEIKNTFDDLSNSGAIKVTQVGEDAELDKMRETAYNQLVNLIFDKVGGQGMADFNQLLPNNQKSMLDRATEMLTAARTEARNENKDIDNANKERRTHELQMKRESRRLMDSIYRARGITYAPVANPETADSKDTPHVPIPAFAVAASYIMKNIRRSGNYSIDLNKYTEDLRTFPFSENVGNIRQTCPTCFTNVNLDDDLYKQREIMVRLMDVNDQDFGPYLSSVEVAVRKKHQSGETTLQNVVIDKASFNKTSNVFRMRYGWKGDTKRDEWLNYEYKTKWTFSGGFEVTTDWQPQEFASIDIAPPLVKKDVYVEIDPEIIQRENIRAAEIKIFFKNSGKEVNRIVNLIASTNVLSKSVELILPRNVDDYEYEVTWFLKGQRPNVKIARTPYNHGSLYLDSLTKL